MRVSGAAGLFLFAFVPQIVGRVLSPGIQDRSLESRGLIAARGQGSSQSEQNSNQNTHGPASDQPTKRLTATTTYHGLDEGSKEKQAFNIMLQAEQPVWEAALRRVNPTHFVFYSVPVHNPGPEKEAHRDFIKEFNAGQHHEMLAKRDKYKAAIWSDMYDEDGRAEIGSWMIRALSFTWSRNHNYLTNYVMSWMFARRAAEAGGDVIFVQTRDEFLPKSHHWTEFEAYELTCATSNLDRLLVLDARAEGGDGKLTVKWKRGDPPLVPNKPDFTYQYKSSTPSRPRTRAGAGDDDDLSD